MILCFYHNYLFSFSFQCLKVVCQDMFFSRSRTTATSQSLIGSPAANSRPALEQALAPLAKKPDDRTNVVDELVDMNVAEPTRTDFTPQVCKLGAHWLLVFPEFRKGPCTILT